VRPTELEFRFLNDLQIAFLPATAWALAPMPAVTQRQPATAQLEET